VTRFDNYNVNVSHHRLYANYMHEYTMSERLGNLMQQGRIDLINI